MEDQVEVAGAGVAAATSARPLSTLDTVATETPTSAATMAIVAERDAGSGGSPAIDALTEVSATFGN